ncbi:MAG: AMP-binding protein [Acidimicrobiales bacterium]
MTEPAWARHLPAGTDPGSVDLTAQETLPRAWVERWRSHPDQEVIVEPGGAWVRARDLLDRTGRAAARLVASGLHTGDRVLVSGAASVDLVVAHVAALRAGLVVVPLNPAYSRRELEVIVGDARPRAAVVERGEIRDWVTAIDPSIVVTDVDLAGLPDRGERLDQVVEDLELDVATGADPALLPYTSGTTGAPKGALLSHANLLASAAALVTAWRWTPADRLILCLPLFHMHGLGVGLHGSLLAGASIVLQPSFDPEAVLSAAADDATLFFGVPTMYSRLVDAPGAERLGGLRLCVSGSAPMSAELHARVRRACGHEVLERYGMTETVMLVSNPHEGERRAGTVGIPLPGVELRLAPGTSEIEVRGPNVFAGYFERPEADADSFTADGWFRTGDIGQLDDEGYLSIVGRAKELIISGGFNVYPREVEDVLRGHPSVIDVAVVGTPSAEWGETVTAYIEADDDLDPAALTAWVADQLAPYKRPRLVHRVDALPRNAMGKVVRGDLRPPDGPTDRPTS